MPKKGQISNHGSAALVLVCYNDKIVLQCYKMVCSHLVTTLKGLGELHQGITQAHLTA